MRRVITGVLAVGLSFALAGCTSSSVTTDVSMSPVEGENGIEAVSGISVPVVGEQMSFSPSQIKVKRGETVTINFTSKNGLHDWVLDEFNTSTKTVSAGETTSVTFVADKAGTFEYYCSVANHRQQGMVGTLIVE